VFDGWYLNGVYQGKLSTITLTMTQDYSLYAVFSQRTTILTIAANPPLKAEQQPPELASGIIVPAQQQQLRHTQLLATTLAGGS
jgi:hypothetical protein